MRYTKNFIEWIGQRGYRMHGTTWYAWPAHEKQEVPLAESTEELQQVFLTNHPKHRLAEQLRKYCVIAGYIIVWLMSIIATLFIAHQAKCQTNDYMNIRFGWSLGPMDGIETYGAGTFPSESKKGRGNFRIFVASGIKVDTNVAYVVNKVKFIIDRSSVEGYFPTIMLSLREFPYNDLAGHDLTKLNSKQKTISGFSNRYTPTNIAAYERYLTRLMEALKAAGYLPRISIELWGEPDATNYFWGFDNEPNRFPAFYTLTAVKYNIVKQYPVKIYHGDYTSSLQRDSAYKGRGTWWNYIKDDSFYLGPIIRSHSFYWTDGGGEFNVNNNDWIDRPGPVCISEYNLYVNYATGSSKDSIARSNEWPFKLYEFLKFVYLKNTENKGTVTDIYIHSLCEYSNASDDKGKLGLIGRYKTPQHQVYYLDKGAWIKFHNMHAVIKDGFYPIPGGLQGKTQKIIFNPDKSYTITN